MSFGLIKFKSDNKNNSKNNKIKIFLKSLFITIIFINIIGPTIVYAAEANQVPAFFGNVKEVWVDEASTEADSALSYLDYSYPSAIDLYGWTVNYPHYRGEISNDDNGKYYYNRKVIYGLSRTMADANLGADAVDSDIRVHCLSNQLGGIEGFFRGLGAAISNGIRVISIWLFSLLVNIKELDLNAIFGIFNTAHSGETLIDKITNILLRDKTTGELSPFMYVFLILWVVSLIGVIFKYVKGEGGFAVIKREILYLVLSVFIFGVAISANGVTGISNTTIKITNALSSAMSSSSTNDIFTCNYTDLHEQAVRSQMSTFAKANINNSICSIFGCNSIDDLDSSNFTLPSLYSSTELDVVSNGTYRAKNIGYMLWAGQSRVNCSNPIDTGASTKCVDYMPGGNTNNIHWLIPDILQESGGLSNQKMVSYANKLNSKDTFGYLGAGFQFFLVSIPFLIAEIFAVYLVMIGKIMLTISGLMLLVLPGLFLWKKSRPLAMDVCRTYIGSFIRVVLGDMIFLITLEMFGILTQDCDPVSIAMAFILFILLAILMPTKIIPSINQMLMEVEGNGSLASSFRRISEAPLNKVSGGTKRVIDNARAKREMRKRRKQLAKEEKSDEDKNRDKNRSLNSMSKIEDTDTPYDEKLNAEEGSNAKPVTSHGEISENESQYERQIDIDGTKNNNDQSNIPPVPIMSSGGGDSRGFDRSQIDEHKKDAYIGDSKSDISEYDEFGYDGSEFSEPSSMPKQQRMDQEYQPSDYTEQSHEEDINYGKHQRVIPGSGESDQTSYIDENPDLIQPEQQETHERHEKRIAEESRILPSNYSDEYSPVPMSAYESQNPESFYDEYTDTSKPYSPLREYSSSDIAVPEESISSEQYNYQKQYYGEYSEDYAEDYDYQESPSRPNENLKDQSVHREPEVVGKKKRQPFRISFGKKDEMVVETAQVALERERRESAGKSLQMNSNSDMGNDFRQEQYRDPAETSRSGSMHPKIDARNESSIRRDPTQISREGPYIRRGPTQISGEESSIRRNPPQTSRDESSARRVFAQTSRDESSVRRGPTPIERDGPSVRRSSTPIVSDESSARRGPSREIRNESPIRREQAPATMDESSARRSSTQAMREEPSARRGPVQAERNESQIRRNVSPTTREEPQTRRDVDPPIREESRMQAGRQESKYSDQRQRSDSSRQSGLHLEDGSTGRRQFERRPSKYSEESLVYQDQNDENPDDQRRIKFHRPE